MNPRGNGAFRPAWWARSGFAQTVATAIGGRGERPVLRLDTWDTPDGDRLRLHFLDAPADMPTVLLAAGRTPGGSTASMAARSASHTVTMYSSTLVWRYGGFGYIGSNGGDDVNPSATALPQTTIDASATSIRRTSDLEVAAAIRDVTADGLIMESSA